MLFENARDEGNDSRAEDLKKIQAAGQALLYSVNDLLVPEKIASGYVDLSDMAALGARSLFVFSNENAKLAADCYPRTRSVSPISDSILITRAPACANKKPQYGPLYTWPKSSTVTPDKG